MDNIILKGVGIFWVVIGGWRFISVIRKGRPPSETEGRSRFGLKGLGGLIDGLFWFVLGVATLMGAFTLDMSAFFLPGFGFFSIAIGLWTLTSVFFTSNQAGEPAAPGTEDPARSETPPTPEANEEMRPAQARSAGMGTAWFLVLLGGAMLWFSDFHVGAKPEIAANPDDPNDSLEDIVKQAVEQEFERKAHIGMIVGAVADGDEVLLGFGKPRLGGSEPVDADTVFEIGSISKVFTGILLAKKVESGELNLDDPIKELVPEGWTLSKAAQGITLRHLTTHTSGIPRLPTNMIGFSFVFKPLFGGDPYRHYTEESFREALESIALDFEPGTDRSYSNFAVGLLGFLLTTHNGTDYETLLLTELCEPLGLERTASINNDWHLEHFAEGYRTSSKAGPAMLAMGSSQWLLPNPLAGAGGIRSTGTDMMKFLKSNMGLVSTPFDAAIELSHEEIYKENDFRSMGMNWIRDFEDDLSQNILWHNGGTGGFKTFLGFTEDRRFGVFALSNASISVDGMGDSLLKKLVRQYSDLGPVTEDGYAKVAPYSGVRWEGDRPIVLVNDHWSPLVSIDGLPIDRIMEFAREEFGDKAHKRFGEDLVELLSKMGHDPDWEVTLGLEGEDGQVEELRVAMTEENRALARD